MLAILDFVATFLSLSSLTSNLRDCISPQRIKNKESRPWFIVRMLSTMRTQLLFLWTILLGSFLIIPVHGFVASYSTSSESLVRQHVALERQKRYLLYPSGDPARVQLILGLGVPVDLEDESVTIGYVIKILYHIPQVPEDYSTHMFDSASIVRAFGNAHDTVVIEGNHTSESNQSVNTDRLRTSNIYERYDGVEVEEMDEKRNANKSCSLKSCAERKINEEEIQNYENYEKIQLDPIIKDYFVPKYGFDNSDKHKDEQSVNIKEDLKESVEGDKEYTNELKSEEDDKANKIRRKRDNSEKNEDFKISNKNKDDVYRRFIKNPEGETIRDKENNDGYPEMTPLREDFKGGERDDELIAPPKTTRWGLYKVLENMMEQKGYEGRPCMLRTICEAAETPFTHKNGVLGELVHILLTPSTTEEEISHSSDKDYHTAEKRGLMKDVDCEEMYPDCEESLLELFSEVGFDHLLD